MAAKALFADTFLSACAAAAAGNRAGGMRCGWRLWMKRERRARRWAFWLDGRYGAGGMGEGGHSTCGGSGAIVRGCGLSSLSHGHALWLPLYKTRLTRRRCGAAARTWHFTRDLFAAGSLRVLLSRRVCRYGMMRWRARGGDGAMEDRGGRRRTEGGEGGRGAAALGLSISRRRL